MTTPERSGEGVLLIHGAHLADALQPLVQERSDVRIHPPNRQPVPALRPPARRKGAYSALKD
jgi:hypothetical protein